MRGSTKIILLTVTIALLSAVLFAKKGLEVFMVAFLATPLFLSLFLILAAIQVFLKINSPRIKQMTRAAVWGIYLPVIFCVVFILANLFYSNHKEAKLNKDIAKTIEESAGPYWKKSCPNNITQSLKKKFSKQDFKVDWQAPKCIISYHESEGFSVKSHIFTLERIERNPKVTYSSWSD